MTAENDCQILLASRPRGEPGPDNDHPVDREDNHYPAPLAGVDAARVRLTGSPKEDRHALPTP
jgi:hypothetical protein